MKQKTPGIELNTGAVNLLREGGDVALVAMGIRLKRLGIPDGEYAAAADRDFTRRYHGFDAQGIAKTALALRELLLK